MLGAPLVGNVHVNCWRKLGNTCPKPSLDCRAAAEPCLLGSKADIAQTRAHIAFRPNAEVRCVTFQTSLLELAGVVPGEIR
jgi:hypothetical protein